MLMGTQRKEPGPDGALVLKTAEELLGAARTDTQPAARAWDGLPTLACERTEAHGSSLGKTGPKPEGPACPRPVCRLRHSPSGKQCGSQTDKLPT